MEQLSNIFDSHAHYDDKKFSGDRFALLDELPNRGVRYVVNAGSDLRSSQMGVDLAARYSYIYCAIGVHPHDAARSPEDLERQLRELAKRPKVVALGEMGLDYHYDFSPREKQREVFERQLVLAAELNLPVIVHDREAHADTLSLLKKYKPRGVVHCFSGPAEMARELAGLGLYVGFTGVITFKNARRALEALRVLPRDRILVETDCPYMAPEPLRGQRCDSSMIPHTAAVMARSMEMDTQQLLDLTCRNARTLYAI